jgi:hypothetical protein
MIVFLETPERRTCPRLTTPAWSAMTRRRLGGIVLCMRPSIQALADIPLPGALAGPARRAPGPVTLSGAGFTRKFRSSRK